MEETQPENKPAKKVAVIESTEPWKEFGLKDRALFDRICSHYKFKSDTMRENLQKLQHRSAIRTIRLTGEKQTCFELRTKGRDGSHAVVNGSDGIWYCMCPKYLFNGGMRSMIPCKHLIYLIVNGLGRPEDWMQYLV
jgi:hypothetical protein